MKQFLATLLALLAFASPALAANEVVFNYGTTGATLYLVDFNASGQAWDTTGTPAYEMFTTTREDYDIALAEVGTTGLYLGSLPASAGTHYWTIYLDGDGGSPATTDVAIGAGAGYFDLTDIGDEAIIDAVDGVGGGGFNTTERAQILAALAVDGEIDVAKQLIWTVSRKDGKVGSSVPIVIDPDETVEVACDFRNVLASGDAIASITSVALVADADVGDDVESPAFLDVDDAELYMSTAVKFDLTGGTSGNTDQIKVTVLTVNGKTIAANVKVKPSSE